MSENRIAKVEYQVATYSGTLYITCDENDENDHVIALAKRQLRREAGEFPFGYESFKVLS